jgi:hypothetical protein
MKKLSLLFVSIGLLTVCLSSCDDNNGGGTPAATSDTVKGPISANTTWSANKKYFLKTFVYVESGATLTIEPGTVIKGLDKGALIVKPGGKLIAKGTATQPIVFTSAKAKGQRNPGDWGGVIILGNAPTNKVNPKIEGENTTSFGGTNAADNSGEISYVRIEFAGIAFEPNREINGLTLGGVGSGTKIDHVQVSYGGDDAFEWFGGNVNANYLVSYRTLDDDFDTDFGYSGKVQYGLIIRDPAVADAAGDSNMFESDNDATGSDLTPQTSAMFANISGFLADGTPSQYYRSAARIRRNSAVSIYNSVFVGKFDNGLELATKGSSDDGTSSSADNFKSGKSDYAGLVLTGMDALLTSAVDATRFDDASRKNDRSKAVADLGLAAGYNSLTAKPGMLPTGAFLKSGGATLPSGFTATTYRGAFNDTDWTEGWTNFDPQNTDY